MTKVAFIAHLSEISGAGVALLETVAGLSQAYETWLIVPGDGPLVARAKEKGVRCIIIPNPESAMLDSSLRQKLSMVAARSKYIKALRHFLRVQKINLAYVNSSVSIFPGVAARLAGVPVAWHIHETMDESAGRNKWKKKLIQRLADGLIYASQSAMASLPPPPGTPAMVARNFVPLQQFNAVAEARTGLPAQSHILLNGTFHRKAPDVLLQAVIELKHTNPELNPHVEITGQGNPEDPYFKKVTGIAGEPNLKERVSFAGLQPSLLKPLTRASVFVSASRSEALPISIVEAMAAGVPVIATDVGDCADLLDHGKSGWIIPPESPKQLADALREVLTQPETVIAKTRHAREKVTRLYHAENFWEPLQQFLDGIIARHTQ